MAIPSKPASSETKEAIFLRLLREIPKETKFTFREISQKIKKICGYPVSAKEFDILIYTLQKKGWKITCATRFFRNPPRVEVFYQIQSRFPSVGEREKK